MIPEVQKRADELVNGGFEVPAIFKAILKREALLVEDTEILDYVYLPREYRDERAKKGEIFKHAHLLLATAKGIIFVQEGSEEIDVNLGGYRVRYLPYNRVVAIEVDSILMQAELRIYSGAGEEVRLEVDFNRKRFFKEVTQFVNIIRKYV